MRRRPLILLLFFASGFCGLVYEVVWMRHLSLVFGNTIYATATVLAGFMGGLAIGSLLFGKVADRVENPLRLYGIVELLIGALALLFPLILRGLLLIPTTLMGGTLPVLTKFLGSSTALNTDDLLYLELVTPRSTIRGSREIPLVPLYTELIEQRESVFPYVHFSGGTGARRLPSLLQFLGTRLASAAHGGAESV